MGKLSVYKASAGSGKTFTLAARYIALLLQHESFSSILAVTFTNKATTEMKQRILTNLYLIGSGGMPPEDSFFRKVLEFLPEKDKQDENKLRKLAHRKLQEILNDYDRFAICTIDTFLQTILGGMARYIWLRASYEVDINASKTINDAIDRLIARYGEMDEKTQEKILNFVISEINNDDKWDIRKKLKKVGDYLTKESFLKNRNEILSSVKDDKETKTFSNTLNAIINNNEREQLQTEVAHFKQAYPQEEWVKKSSVLTYLRKLDKYLGNPQGCSYAEPANKVIKGIEERRITEYKGKKNIEELIGKIDSIIEKAKSYSFKANSASLSRKRINELGLLKKISELVDEIESENNSLMLNMTPVKLNEMLKGDDTLFILEQAGTLYRHIMIDEFQDTSRLQWEIFKPLVKEMIAHEEGTALIVGDVKQSIYRWRNGDWKMLNNIEQEIEDVQIMPLSKNFRSYKNVVNFNLSLFKYCTANLEVDKEQVIKGIYNEDFDENRLVDFYNTSKDGGYVNVYAFQSNASEQDVIERMFSLIQQMVDRGTDQNSITILVRKNKEVQKVTNYLDEQKALGNYSQLEIISADAYQLSSSKSVQILINALKSLLNPYDRIAKFYTIYFYRTLILGETVSWKMVDEAAREGYLEKLIEPYMQKHKLYSLPLYEMLELLARVFLYNKDGEKPLKDDSYLTAFFDSLTSFIHSNNATPQSFVDYWDETLQTSSINTTEEGGIKIMTVHRSKGLENDTIFIPFCTWKLTDDVHAEDLWCETPNEFPYNKMRRLPIEIGEKMKNSLYRENYQTEQFNKVVDSLNTLYVALTRARKNLFISGVYQGKVLTVMDLIQQYLKSKGAVSEKAIKDCKDKKGCIEYYDGEILFSQDKATEENNRLKQAEEPITLDVKHQEARIEFRQSKKSIELLFGNKDDANSEAMARGTLLHAIFSEIECEEDIVKTVESYFKKGLIDSPQLKTQIISLLTRSLQDERAKEWFDGTWNQNRECTILKLGEDGQRIQLRPDRVITKEGQTIVIDYKFGKASDAYKMQVNEYMDVLTEMGNKNVKGFLWYIGENGSNIVEVSRE